MGPATRPPTRRISGALVALALWLVAAVAMAQPANLRIAYVDMQRVIREASAFTEGRKQLTEEFADRDRALKLEQARLQELQARRDRELDTLSNTELAQLRREIDTLDNTIQRRKNELQKLLVQRMKEITASIDQSVREEIAAFARAEGYDLVLTDGVGFASPRLDVTDSILKRVNARTAGQSPR